MQAREPGSLGLVLTLATAGLLSGFVLVSVFLATAPRIERNRAEALERAIRAVLPGTVSITTTGLDSDGRLVALDAAPGSVAGEAIYAGRDADGRLVGWAIPAAGPGFMDTIGLIYGFDPARQAIVGLAVLDSRETPGLGDKIITDAGFHANFAALAVEPEIVAVRPGKKTKPNEVDTITGATISSEAVVAILDRSTRRWLPLLESEAALPPRVTADAGGR